MIFSETNTKIAPALAKAWATLENPKHNASVSVKTKSGSSYTFDYTDLGGIFDEAKKTFKDNGLTVIQNAYTSHIEGKKMVSVETMLLHSSGEWVKSEPLQFEANANIQDMGGQITYMKRYSLSAMLGIATEKDDDANGASGNSFEVKSTSSQGVSSKQVGMIKALALQIGKLKGKSDKEVIGLLPNYIGEFEDVAKLTKSQGSKAIELLTEWKEMYSKSA